MATVEEIVLTYVAAWNETDEGERRALLEKSWADNGIYSDPSGEAAGREALVRHIAGFHQRFGGNRILCTSGIDDHHDRLRFTWAMVSPEGRRISEGIDFGELGSDGRLIRITGFFGSPRPFPPSWSANLVLSNEQAHSEGN